MEDSSDDEIDAEDACEPTKQSGGAKRSENGLSSILKTGRGGGSTPFPDINLKRGLASTFFRSNFEKRSCRDADRQKHTSGAKSVIRL